MRRNFKPLPTRPADFEAFWQGTLRQLKDVNPDVQREPLAHGGPPGLRGEVVSFASLGGARVRAYHLYWPDERSRPLVIYSHGYMGQCKVRWEWAEQGVNVLGVDIRGFGMSKGAFAEPSRWGYVLSGVETPEASVLRGAVCDYMQAVRIARQLHEGCIERVVFHGVSFAGGLALMAEGVLNLADLLVVGVPTFGWAEGRNFFVRSGSGAEVAAYLEARPEVVEDVMLVLRYFDAVNFADWVRCPTLVGVGLEDEVVPAKTVYGIANHLGGPYELMEFPVSHTDRPEEQLWKNFEIAWLDLAIEGVPNTFGRE